MHVHKSTSVYLNNCFCSKIYCTKGLTYLIAEICANVAAAGVLKLLCVYIFAGDVNIAYNFGRVFVSSDYINLVRFSGKHYLLSEFFPINDFDISSRHTMCLNLFG